MPTRTTRRAIMLPATKLIHDSRRNSTSVYYDNRSRYIRREQSIEFNKSLVIGGGSTISSAEKKAPCVFCDENGEREDNTEVCSDSSNVNVSRVLCH